MFYVNRLFTLDGRHFEKWRSLLLLAYNSGTVLLAGIKSDTDVPSGAPHGASVYYKLSCLIWFTLQPPCWKMAAVSDISSWLGNAITYSHETWCKCSNKYSDKYSKINIESDLHYRLHLGKCQLILDFLHVSGMLLHTCMKFDTNVPRNILKLF
jgi:hypothetical protein